MWILDEQMIGIRGMYTKKYEVRNFLYGSDYKQVLSVLTCSFDRTHLLLKTGSTLSVHQHHGHTLQTLSPRQTLKPYSIQTINGQMSHCQCVIRGQPLHIFRSGTFESVA